MKDIERPAADDGEPQGIVIAGYFHEPDTYAIRRPQGFRDWLIAYTLGGEGYFAVPGREPLRCGAGDVTLLAPDTPHRYGTAKDAKWHFVWAHFSPGQVESGLLPEEPLSQQRIENEHVRKRIYRAFRRILADSRERSDYWNELCLNALREVLMLLAQRKRRGIDPRVEEALHLLSLRMREPVRVGELAKAVGVSTSRLSHLFKAETGLSIVDTLNRMRVRQAALLLEHSGRSAAEVCYDAGFQNYNHFINQFRKWAGMSPSAYKKRMRPEG
ncbi:helix-turn-helix domain-containing protein [Paenibacillus humicola]|uniref:helix-turn-helix domain-containing protein n=1 Tax=Paenibacillus humicola TaxID=3110540 RepID=UPI00237C136D|nr:helix-turn-helix domain-containing protein [Paenibacillus humicola]